MDPVQHLNEEIELHNLKNTLTVLQLKGDYALMLLRSAFPAIKHCTFITPKLLTEIEDFLEMAQEKPNGRTAETEGAQSQSS